MKEINPLYMQKETMEEIKDSFTQSSPHIIHLPHFFSLSVYESLLKEMQSAQGTKKKIANRYAYTQINTKEPAFLNSVEFSRWLSTITAKNSKKVEFVVRSFTHRDYTLLHDSETIGARLEFFILLMKKWDTRWGGHTVYVAENKEPLLFPLEGNSLSLIQKEKYRHKFLQYINHHAQKEKLIIIQGTLH